jgi:2-(1,2-epoxy-1,2-dihydrophenyl)acetyl-CoA isomerase
MSINNNYRPRAPVEELLLERGDDGVVTLTLNRPRRRNAIPSWLWDPLRRAFDEVSRNESDRVLVVTGAGGHFCSGADLADDGALQSHPLHGMRLVNTAALALHEITVPTIAKVRGDAVGAGMNLALGCDLVVAAESARFAQVFVRRSLSVDFGGTWLLPRAVGMHKAKELALFGDFLSAKDAERIGIVNRVVSDGELDDFVDDWARRLAAGPPLALQFTRRMLSNSFSVGMAEALDAEAASQSVNLVSEDTREGIKAFLEKRPPRFAGR